MPIGKVSFSFLVAFLGVASASESNTIISADDFLLLAIFVYWNSEIKTRINPFKSIHQEIVRKIAIS